MATRGRQWGLGEGASQIAGDMAYEATLLGLHGGLRNLTEKGVSDFYDLDTIQKPLQRATKWRQDHTNPIHITKACNLFFG